MEKQSVRLTAHVHKDHPLFKVLSNAERQGAKLLLAYATSWYAYSLGKAEQTTPIETAPKPKPRQDPNDELPDEFLNDALS